VLKGEALQGKIRSFILTMLILKFELHPREDIK